MNKKSSVWDGVARDYHKVSKESVAHINKISRVASVILEIDPKNILDLGCGSGVLEQELDRRGYRGAILALDSSSEMISIAVGHTYLNKDICFEISDMEAGITSIKKGEFDLVASINSIFCIRDRRGFLEKVRGLLRDNGTLLIVSPQPIADNKKFFKEQFSGRGIAGFIGFLRVLGAIPTIVRLMLFEKEVEKTYGLNVYPTQSQLVEDIEAAGYRVDSIESIQAGQNFFIQASTGERT